MNSAMLQEKILQTLSVYLNDRVLFALVYGSILKPSFNQQSDVDVAVYPKVYGSTFKELLDLKTELSALIQRDTDVVFLDRADLIIAMQVLANAQLIVNRDPNAFAEFKALQYLDFKMSRAIIEKHMLKGRIYA